MTPRIIALICVAPFILLTVVGIVVELLNVWRHGTPSDNSRPPR